MTETFQTIAARDLVPGHIVVDPDHTQRTVKTVGTWSLGVAARFVDGTVRTYRADQTLVVRADTATDAEFDV